jgi:hypothetical protein
MRNKLPEHILAPIRIQTHHIPPFILQTLQASPFMLLILSHLLNLPLLPYNHAFSLFPLLLTHNEHLALELVPADGFVEPQTLLLVVLLDRHGLGLPPAELSLALFDVVQFDDVEL